MEPLPPAFLTLPARGDATYGRIARKLKLLLVRRLLVESGHGVNARNAAAFSRFTELFTQALRATPDDALAAVGSPDVAVALLTLGAEPAVAEERLSRAVVGILHALAGDGDQRGRLGESVVWEAPLERLIDARQRWALELAPAGRALRAGPLGTELELASGRHPSVAELFGSSPGEPSVTFRRPFHPLSERAPGLVLSELDTNPLAMLEAHPTKSGNALSLGGRSLDEWQAALAHALELIEVALPDWFAELGLALRRILPVGYEPERHLSASYREAPGIAYLTLHPDPLTLAEAIIHETQHGKLNLLSYLDPVLKNGYSAWTASPVRPDLRPLMGVLLAVHAFVPVAAFHDGLLRAGHELSRAARFADRRQQVLRGNAEGLRVLRDRAEPTDLGKRLLGDLDVLHRALGGPAPASASAQISEALG